MNAARGLALLLLASWLAACDAGMESAGGAPSEPADSAADELDPERVSPISGSDTSSGRRRWWITSDTPACPTT